MSQRRHAYVQSQKWPGTGLGTFRVGQNVRRPVPRGGGAALSCWGCLWLRPYPAHEISETESLRYKINGLQRRVLDGYTLPATLLLGPVLDLPRIEHLRETFR